MSPSTCHAEKYIQPQDELPQDLRFAFQLNVYYLSVYDI